MNAIERDDLDATQAEYEFAGGLLGSKWKFPDGSVREVVEVVKDSDRIEGQRLTFPTVCFDLKGRLAANSFRQKIRTDADWGVTPANGIALEIFSQVIGETPDRDGAESNQGDA